MPSLIDAHLHRFGHHLRMMGARSAAADLPARERRSHSSFKFPSPHELTCSVEASGENILSLRKTHVGHARVRAFLSLTRRSIPPIYALFAINPVARRGDLKTQLAPR